MALGGGYFKTTYASDLALVDTRLRRVALAVFVVALLLLPRFGSSFILDLAAQTALAAVGALALNLLTELAGYLSGGERQMLALGTALLCRPIVLLVDELSLGLAPIVVESLMEMVRRFRDELGLAVLLVEQNAGAALGVADHGYVMEHGRIVYEGTRERLLAHEDIREFYLGVGRSADRKSDTEVKQYRRRRRWF